MTANGTRWSKATGPFLAVASVVDERSVKQLHALTSCPTTWNKAKTKLGTVDNICTELIEAIEQCEAWPRKHTTSKPPCPALLNIAQELETAAIRLRLDAMCQLGNNCFIHLRKPFD